MPEAELVGEARTVWLGQFGQRNRLFPGFVTENGKSSAAPSNTADTAGSRLTPRQVDIVRLIVAGCTDKELAPQLGMSLGTLHTHLDAVRVQGALQKANSN